MARGHHATVISHLAFIQGSATLGQEKVWPAKLVLQSTATACPVMRNIHSMVCVFILEGPRLDFLA
jgi:hypothetical protein